MLRNVPRFPIEIEEPRGPIVQLDPELLRSMDWSGLTRTAVR